jgi:hypothetical protein
MQRPVGDQEWVWVIIERDETEEQILGRMDQERKESFIPVFRSKEDGLMCLGRLEKKPAHNYQVQAMRFGEVAQAARENQFMVFFLSEEGEILDRIAFKH